MTRVVNAKFLKAGWQKDPRYVDVRRNRGRLGRHPGDRGYHGNPFPLSLFPLSESLDLFRAYGDRRLVTDPDFRESVRAMRGKELACCCVGKEGWSVGDPGPHVCHAQWYAEAAERLAAEGVRA